MALLEGFAREHGLQIEEAAKALLDESVPSLFFKSLPPSTGKVLPFIARGEQ